MERPQGGDQTSGKTGYTRSKRRSATRRWAQRWRLPPLAALFTHDGAGGRADGAGGAGGVSWSGQPKKTPSCGYNPLAFFERHLKTAAPAAA